MRDVVETWFSLTRPVDRRFYAASGFSLVLFKYAVDCGLVLFPQLYRNLWSDALIHRIHRRVLEHVKLVSEGRA